MRDVLSLYSYLVNNIKYTRKLFLSCCAVLKYGQHTHGSRLLHPHVQTRTHSEGGGGGMGGQAKNKRRSVNGLCTRV